MRIPGREPAKKLDQVRFGLKRKKTKDEVFQEEALETVLDQIGFYDKVPTDGRPPLLDIGDIEFPDPGDGGGGGTSYPIEGVVTATSPLLVLAEGDTYECSNASGVTLIPNDVVLMVPTSSSTGVVTALIYRPGFDGGTEPIQPIPQPGWPKPNFTVVNPEGLAFVDPSGELALVDQVGNWQRPDSAASGRLPTVPGDLAGGNTGIYATVSIWNNVVVGSIFISSSRMSYLVTWDYNNEEWVEAAPPLDMYSLVPAGFTACRYQYLTSGSLYDARDIPGVRVLVSRSDTSIYNDLQGTTPGTRYGAQEYQIHYWQPSLANGLPYGNYTTESFRLPAGPVGSYDSNPPSLNVTGLTRGQGGWLLYQQLTGSSNSNDSGCSVKVKLEPGSTPSEVGPNTTSRIVSFTGTTDANGIRHDVGGVSGSLTHERFFDLTNNPTTEVGILAYSDYDSSTVNGQQTYIFSPGGSVNGHKDPRVLPDGTLLFLMVRMEESWTGTNYHPDGGSIGVNNLHTVQLIASSGTGSSTATTVAGPVSWQYTSDSSTRVLNNPAGYYYTTYTGALERNVSTSNRSQGARLMSVADGYLYYTIEQGVYDENGELAPGSGPTLLGRFELS